MKRSGLWRGLKRAGSNCSISCSGGELTTLCRIEFSDLKKLHIVGIYPNYARAYDAWKDAAHRTVDDAHMRYFIVHLHRLLDPGERGVA
jgi:hypothetical protein